MGIELQQAFLKQLKTKIDNSELMLPTLPEVAIKVRDAASQENTTAIQLANIIATDAALSARLLQVANSPLYRARHEIDNIVIAITRMGNKVVRGLITSLVMQQLYQSTSHNLDTQFRETWENSVNIAAICRALASMTKSLDPEQAMVAGLIHQIGKLPILMLAEDMPELANDEALLNEYLEALHPQVGKMIMDSWEFPESLSTVPWQYTQYDRDVSPVADYVDVVTVAHLESLSASGNTLIDLATVPAFSKLGLQPELHVMEIEGIAVEVEEAQNLMM
jgi:HD-like signal output (HDOD) protein